MTIFQRLLPAPDKKFAPEPCLNCPLPGGRKVGARGTEDSPLVIILEAPGTEELKYGAPICGPSGDLLDKSVPESFDFDTAYVINAMQCRPPKSDNPQKDKEFKARACAACRERVLSQVFRHPRKAVLAMGAWSNSVLLTDYNFKITQRRGEVYAITNPADGTEVVVVPTVHPAFLLRGAGNPKVFRDDIALAVSLAFDPEAKELPVRKIEWVDPTNQVLETIEDLQGYAQKLEGLRSNFPDGIVNVASDTETSGFNHQTDYILCIGFYVKDKDDTAAIIPNRALQDGAFCHYLKQLLKLPWLRFIWQNGKFDEKFLRNDDLIDADTEIVQEDTLLLSYALSEATKDHDLDEQAKNVLGAPEHKHALKKWVPNKASSYANVPEPILFDYTAKDLKKTYLVYEHNRALVRADGHLEKLYTHTLLPASHFLAGVEEYGIATDPDFVRINRFGANEEELKALGYPRLYDVKDKKQERPLPELGLENELGIIQQELETLVGYKVNPSSPPEVAELLYERYGLRIKNKKPTDTRKETLDKLPPHPAVKLIRKYRSILKMLSTYVGAIEKLADSKGIIHTTYKLHATTTGRLSSSEPNIQNIPREARFRRMYRARPGYVLLESDYNSAELRMLACLSGDPTLMAIFLDDKRNLHDEVSVQMYGPDFTDDQRIRAKAINFGIPYGRDAHSIAEEFDISGMEAQRLIESWFRQFPGARKFLDASGNAAATGKTLITVFGRKRRPGVVSPERLDGLQNEFKNFHMQSPISDFTLHSGMEFQPIILPYDSHVVNLIHDSTLTEVPDDYATIRDVAKIIQDTMHEVPKRWIDTPIQFKADLKVGTWWGMGMKWDKWLAKMEAERPKIFAVPQLQQAAA